MLSKGGVLAAVGAMAIWTSPTRAADLTAPVPAPTDYLAAKPAQRVGAIRFSVRQPKRLKTPTSPGRIVVFILDSRKLLKDGSNPPYVSNPIHGPNTHPAFGEDLKGRLGPGRHATLTDGPRTFGYPLQRTRDLRAGTYAIQAVFQRYTVFHLASGKTVELPMPCGDGQEKLRFQPGNLISNVVRVKLAPHRRRTVHLTFKSENKPPDPVPKGGNCQQGNPKPTAQIKEVKIKSRLLSKFWGRPMYIAADVMLPAGYDDPANADVRYPSLWTIGHYNEGSPFAPAQESDADDPTKFWNAPGAPRMIAVSPRTETPYYDDSYGINGANTGPWGDAINKELLPYIDAHFRTIPERWARMTWGGSTSGWTAAAQQIFYPANWEGAFIQSPDPMDFRAMELINIYRDKNMYWRIENGFQRTPIPDARVSGVLNGKTDFTMQMENDQVAVRGTHNRGNGDWDGGWAADFGPQGRDGYPVPLWNAHTGAINHAVANYWRRWDLDHYVTSHWSTLGPKIAGQLEFYVGDADTFFLDNGVRLFQRATDKLTNPSTGFTFHYYPLYGHELLPIFVPDPTPPIKRFGWDQFFQHIATHMAADAPPGAPMAWMRAAG
jgi:hypothetical protein